MFRGLDRESRPIMPNVTTRSTSSPSWLRRIALGLLLLVLALAACGFLYENVSEARDRRFNPMPGKRVDVGGYKMHIDCAGQGSPTVVFDSGLADPYITWYKVQPEIAKSTAACSFDRAGVGYSDPSSRPRTSKVIAEELHALLHAAGIAPPYILVGHSMGGYDVRLFASMYRSEVVGMVLVDASHPDQENRFPSELTKSEGRYIREVEFFEYTSPFGIPRLLGVCEGGAARRAAECNFHTARENVAEMKAFSESAAETAATGSLGDMPLIVLSHDPDMPQQDFPAELTKPVNEAWAKMQVELAHLSTRGTQQTVKGSSHYIQLDCPEAVIDAVRSVVTQARSVSTASLPKS
jgi:pimeloyl-ACP methyl ester carboxylesterase